jgi:hypothetical protein
MKKKRKSRKSKKEKNRKETRLSFESPLSPQGSRRSLYDTKVEYIATEILNADIEWAKHNLEDAEIADELKRTQKKLRDRNEMYVLMTGAKRQVLGAGMQTVRWESKSAKDLVELFGSLERAEQIKNMQGEAKELTIKRLKEQMEGLAKYQEEIAHHYAFCTEILKRASDAQNIDTLILRLRKMALENREKWSEEIGRELAKRQESLAHESESESDEDDQADEIDEDEEMDAEQQVQEESLLVELSSSLNISTLGTLSSDNQSPATASIPAQSPSPAQSQSPERFFFDKKQTNLCVSILQTLFVFI